MQPGATPFCVEFTAKDRGLLKTDNRAVNTVKCDEVYDGEGYTTYCKNTDQVEANLVLGVQEGLLQRKWVVVVVLIEAYRIRK